MAIRIKGGKELQRKFKKLAKKLKNRRKLFNRIGVVLLNDVTKSFKDEAHEGKSWKTLSPNTILRRRKGKGAGTARILQDTGKLKGSFAMKVGRDEVRVGSNVDYAPFHEEGKGKIPQRKMLPSDERALELAVDTTENLIEEEIKKARL